MDLLKFLVALFFECAYVFAQIPDCPIPYRSAAGNSQSRLRADLFGGSMLYPLKFQPVYKNYIWGGRNLAALGKILPAEGPVAESWELSAHPNGVSVVANGPLAGRTLPELLRQYGVELIGTQVDPRYLDKFPLLIKLIDAQDRLSVQVHPDDDYAAGHEKGEWGKNEMWYVVKAEPGARLVAGVRPGTTRGQFARVMNSPDCMDLLVQIPVKPGDVLNIPAGLVHAIGAGLLICEIQQNSDTTYRVYDYDRRDSAGQTRPLHLEQSLDVIDFTADRPPLSKGLRIQDPQAPDLARRVLVLNRYFGVEEWKVSGVVHRQTQGERFMTMTVLEGSGRLNWSDQEEKTAGKSVDLTGFSDPAEGRPDPILAGCELLLAQGETVLIPASVRSWQIEGHLLAIISYVADFEKDICALAAEHLLQINPFRQQAVKPDLNQAIQLIESDVALQPKP